MAHAVSRNINCSGAVNCSGGLTSSGQTVLRGVSWPSSEGSTGQVLQLLSASQATWATPVSGASGYTRDVTTSASYIMSSSAEVLFVNRSSGAIITLPSVASAGDKYYAVIDKSGAISVSSPILIQPASGDTIMGASSFSLQAPYNSVKLVHDAENMWFLV